MAHRFNRPSARPNQDREMRGRVAYIAVVSHVATMRIGVTFGALSAANGKGAVEFRSLCILPFGHGECSLLLRAGLMAKRAPRGAVSTPERELRHGVMTELRRALFRPVAAAAILAQLALVGVIRRMAIDTSVLLERILIVLMASLARDGLMFPFEGEHRMVKVVGAR